MYHPQLKYFFSPIESEYGDVLYYTEVHWLNCGRMLKHGHDMKSETELFLEL